MRKYQFHLSMTSIIKHSTNARGFGVFCEIMIFVTFQAWNVWKDKKSNCRCCCNVCVSPAAVFFLVPIYWGWHDSSANNDISNIKWKAAAMKKWKAQNLKLELYGRKLSSEIIFMWNDKTGICVTSRIIFGLVISNLVSRRSINDIAGNPIAALSRKSYSNL